jgi:SulP family sulfate permease
VTQTTGPRSPHWLWDEFQSERLLPSLTAGVLMGITEVIYALSLGSLIFSGDLGAYLSFGIGIALITPTIVLICISLGTSVPGVTGTSQDSSSLVLAVIAAALVSALSASGAEDRLTTVLAAIATTTLLTGVFFLALGMFKLGGLVRFIPYPVMGGFLAATGWLLARGSFGVMASFPLTLSNLPALLGPDQLLLWVPGVLFALVLFFGLRRTNRLMAMPAILVGAIVVFYLALLVTGTSVGEARDQGLLLGEVSGKATWHPLAPADLLAANWRAIMGQGGNIAIVLILSVVGLLLNASGIELAVRQDIDLNRELRVAGLANILSGLGGGMVGYHALDLSTLCRRIGVRSRLPGVVAGVICAAMLLAGSALIALFPKPILGGLLLFLGLCFLVEWVVEGWFRLSRADYAVVLLILVVTAATDFLIGVGLGLVVMIILFVLNYSRIDVVHHALSGAEITSNVERFAHHRRILTALGKHTYVLELRGFIFFGTANALLERIRARVADTGQLPVRYIALDFRRVTGLDSSAVFSFVKCRQLAEAHNITLVLTHISEEIQHQFELGGLLGVGEDVRFFPDLDRGLEWCENQLLEVERIAEIRVPTTLRQQLAESGFAAASITRLMGFLEQVEVEAGEYLIRQGDEADDLYFIEQGKVSVYLELESGQRVRLQTLGLGTIVGELGMYLDTTRTASVTADSPTIAYRLTRMALFEMKEREPELAATFHEFAVRLLSERLAATNHALEAVLR